MFAYLAADTDALIDDARVAPPLSLRKPQDWPSVLTTAQVAELLSVNRQTVLIMIARRELPASRVGKLWRIAPEDVWPFVPPGIRARWPEGPWHDVAPP
ncbi:MAG TPA: helix-turn-helix domain-containing protein [Solirubrobacteraceae bacterium]|jgi:excisionase family DNA binding protein